MNILMMTNTYLPFVGGVERSVETFSRELRKRGHDVLIVAPEYEDMPEHEEHVVRVPAIQHFNGTDFSVSLPIPGFLHDRLEKFKPDIVHSHHPFLLGATAVRVSSRYDLPLVFTFHTLYEEYTHYVPGDSDAMKRFVIELSTGYSNLCDQVIAPSKSIAAVLQKRNVIAPVEVIPTGIHTDRFANGDSRRFRSKYSIPDDAFVIGFISRLAPEKNIDFLNEIAAGFLKKHDDSFFVVVGTGSSEETIEEFFETENLSGRLVMTGNLDGQELIDAYHGLDVFVFVSKSETQGLVVEEAMAAGLPVVALEASGVREVMKDNENGRMIRQENVDLFVEALDELYDTTDEERQRLRKGALDTAEKYSVHHSIDRIEKVYNRLRETGQIVHKDHENVEAIRRRIKSEWDLIRNVGKAMQAAMGGE